MFKFHLNQTCVHISPFLISTSILKNRWVWLLCWYIFNNIIWLSAFHCKKKISFFHFSRLSHLSMLISSYVQPKVNIGNLFIFPSRISSYTCKWHICIYIPSSSICPLHQYGVQKSYYCVFIKKMECPYLFLFFVFFQLSHPWCLIAVSIGRLLEMYIWDYILEISPFTG